MQSQSSKYTRANKGNPCPICGRMSRCSRTEDGLYFCWEQETDKEGWKHLGAAKADPRFHLFRRSDDPLLRNGHTDQGAAAPHSGGERKPAETPLRSDLLGRAQLYASRLQIGQTVALAEHLGLPVQALEAVQLLGRWEDRGHNPAWCWPEVDGAGQVIGIQRRFLDGTQLATRGGSRGLVVNQRWEEMDGAVYVVEGMSNVCALHALGIRAFGVYTAGGGAGMVAETLQGAGRTAAVVVLADRDEKEDGSRPGYDGAVKLARELSALLGREVHWSFPPDKAKDARAWLQARLHAPYDHVAWPEVRKTFLDGLRLQCITPTPQEAEPEDHTGLDTQAFSQVIPEALDFLIPQYFARGKLHIIAGPGGVGKSRWTYEFAARASRGQPWGGLMTGVPRPMPVLLANCEDGHRDTISPCLYAAGADLERVRRLIAAVEPDGKSVRFSLTNLAAIEAHFRRTDEPGWLVIDPVGSFTGGGGFDAFRESDVKQLLDPLAELLEKFGWTCILVMHLNKGSGRKAIDRLMNSVAFGNTARGVYGLYESLDDEDQRDFLPMKYNMGKCPRGRSYLIRDLYAAEQDQVGDLLRGKITTETWAKLAPQLSRLDSWRDTDRTAEDANADDDAPQQELPEDVRTAERYLRLYLEGVPQLPKDCVEHVSEKLHKEVSLKWLRTRVFKARLHGVTRRVPGTPPIVMWELPGQTQS